MYDFLIVGSGLAGATFANLATNDGYKCLILEKKNQIAGNIFSENISGVIVHVYGPHLFRSNNKKVWDFVNKFAQFNHYQHKIKAINDKKVYSLPFNMTTYNQLWGCITPEEAKIELEKQKIPIANPQNLEEWCLSHVGGEIYHKLIYGYTRKQWMRDPKELPANIIQRLPLRMTWDENYFDDIYQGVPIHGYTNMIENMIGNTSVLLNTDFFDDLDNNWKKIAKKLVFTGSIDQLFDYKYGRLEYRTMRFDQQIVNGNFQGIGQMNYTEYSVPWTRIIEHKHFAYSNNEKSVISYEYPEEWIPTSIPMYPINDEKNNAIYQLYKRELLNHKDITGCGRLFRYRYFNMDAVIANAMKTYRELN